MVLVLLQLLEQEVSAGDDGVEWRWSNNNERCWREYGRGGETDKMKKKKKEISTERAKKAGPEKRRRCEAGKQSGPPSPLSSLQRQS
jgi:hypothetical protein